MAIKEFRGIYTALATPFKDDSVDYGDLESLVENKKVKGKSCRNRRKDKK